MPLPPDPAQVQARAKRTKMVVLDVDGVLTDGKLYYYPGGGEGRAFHVRDGLGVTLMRAAGIPVACISGRTSDAVLRRAEELGIAPVLQGVEDKVAAVEQLCADMSVPPEDTCYIGDDLPDIPIIRKVGLGVAVADAAPEVRAAAHFVLGRAGGQGAVRELCELILRAKGSWRI